MKLATVGHERCGEISSRTYVWIPDEWSEDDFAQAVERAQDKFLEFYRGWKELAKTAPNNARSYMKPDYSKYPDKTVAEVDAMWAEMQAEYKEWDAKYQQGKHKFGRYLEAEGCEPFWKHPDDLIDTTAYWGHAHGERYDYEDTRPNKNDLAGPDALDDDEDWD